MPYSDNNPERRNLTILSLAIIVYYLAGGEFLRGEVNLMLINAHFEKPYMLVVIVWLMLLWFLFRYNITNNQRESHHDANKAIYVDMNNFLTRKYLKQKAEDVLIDKLPNTRIHFNNYNKKWTMTVKGDFKSELKGITGYLIKTLYMLKIITKNRSTTDHYTPYLLFLSAVGLGIYNYFGQQTC